MSSTKEEPSTVVVDPLKAVARIVAKHTTITSLTAATPLQTLGLDSLDAMACVRELNAVTGAALSVVDVLSAKTLGEVASLVPTSVDFRLFHRRPGRAAEALFIRGRTPDKRLASLDSLDAMAVVKDLADATGRSWSVSDVLGAETLGDITLKASRTAIPVGRSKEPKAEDKIPVKDLEEPHLLRRLWFTLLARIVGAQIAVCGAMPAFVLESYLPTRWRLAPKMWVLEARVGARVALWVEAQLPRPSRPYPGLPHNAFLRDQRLEFMTTGLRAWTPSYLFIARFTMELCITGVVYYVLVVPRVSFGVRGRKMVHSRTATGRAVPDLGIVDRLPQRPVAVGRALVVFARSGGTPVAAALCANLVFTKRWALPSVPDVVYGDPFRGTPHQETY